MEIDKFDEFDVYKIEEGHSFVYANFNNEDKFIAGLVDYLFSENNLLNHAYITSKINFSGEPRQYLKLYHNISLFLNEEMERCSNEIIELDSVSNDLKEVIKYEYEIRETSNKKIRIQQDKIGKIGEYAFHILLTKYFKLDCILPKFHCQTDRNMSVFGIDTLFLDVNHKRIYFGESKLCKNIENGIKLINNSLSDYEQQIQEEYRIVLSSEDAFKLSDEFLSIFGEAMEMCFSFESLIDKANIKEIGIPIFIAHGKTSSTDIPEKYIELMNKRIINLNFFGLKTMYVLISLPIINKRKFIEEAFRKVFTKQNEYRQRLS